MDITDLEFTPRGQHSNDELYTHKKCTKKALLDVIAVVSNPARFQKRYDLFNDFCKRMRSTPDVRLTTIELQQRARPFVTDATLKFRTKHELWHKENLINVAVQNLPSDWEYVAWVDADIEFQNKGWAQETLEELQTYAVVQLFSHAIDLGPKCETLQVHTGFCYMYCNGEVWNRPGYGKYWHSGYAWAMRKSAYNAIGGLMDFPILGSADTHMALAFIGKIQESLHHNLHQNYKKLCSIFQDRCERHIKRNIGYVKGTILHNFHSCKSQRFYKTRWNILVDNKFDPLADIKKDCNDLWQLEDKKIELRDQLRNYFRQRNEDSIDLHQDYPFMKKNHF